MCAGWGTYQRLTKIHSCWDFVLRQLTPGSAFRHSEGCEAEGPMWACCFRRTTLQQHLGAPCQGLPGLQAFPEPSKLAPTLVQQHSPESTCIPCLLCLQGCLLNSSFVEKMSQGKMWNVQGGGVIMALWNHSYNFKMYIGSFISIVTLLI